MLPAGKRTHKNTNLIKTRFSPVLNRVFILAGEGGLIFSHCSFLAVSSYRIGRRPRHFKPSRPQTGLLNHDVRIAHIRFLRKCRHSIASATRRISVPRLGTKSGETAQKRSRYSFPARAPAHTFPCIIGSIFSQNPLQRSSEDDMII